MDAPDIPDLEYPNGQLARYHRYGEGSVKALVRETESCEDGKYLIAVWYFHRIDGSAIELPRTSSHFPILDGLEKPSREPLNFTLGPVKPGYDPRTLIRFLEHHLWNAGFFLQGARDNEGYPLPHRKERKLFYKLESLLTNRLTTIDIPQYFTNLFAQIHTLGDAKDHHHGFAALDAFWYSEKFANLQLEDKFRHDREVISASSSQPVKAASGIDETPRKRPRL